MLLVVEELVAPVELLMSLPEVDGVEDVALDEEAEPVVEVEAVVDAAPVVVSVEL